MSELSPSADKNQDVDFFSFNSFGAKGFADRSLLNIRKKIYDIFIREMAPQSNDTILDVGVSDDDHPASNFLEKVYPRVGQIVGLGLGDYQNLEALYPGFRYVKGDGRKLPFADGSFDYVYSHAVIEHVGSDEDQVRFVRELGRVARKGVFFTTPNRSHPLEFHTGLPLLHFLPMNLHHRLYGALGKKDFSSMETLHLLFRSDIEDRVRKAGFSTSPDKLKIHSVKWLGFPSNLLACLKK